VHGSPRLRVVPHAARVWLARAAESRGGPMRACTAERACMRALACCRQWPGLTCGACRLGSPIAGSLRWGDTLCAAGSGRPHGADEYILHA